MKKLLSSLLAIALCLSVFAGAGLIASADEAFDRLINATGGTLTFVNDAEHPWVQDTLSIGKYGVSAGNTGVDSSSSTVSSTIVFGENQGIFFTWRASSQQKWDYLAFSVDGVEKARISGDFGPENRSFAVEPGEHVVSWTYVKDDAYGIYNDRGYIDEVYVGSYAPAADIGAVLNDGGSFAFENDAAEPWTAQGSYAVSGNAGKSASESAVTLRTALEAGKVFSFNWGVSSETGHDRLVFEVNGAEAAAISGEVAYPAAYTYVAPEAGEYVFRWVYAKDTLNDFGSDCGYLGGVRVSDYVSTTGVMTVKNTTVAVGKTLKLTFATKPTGATSRAVTWASDNEAVATVDENGVVTGVSAGTVNVTVTTVEGGFTSTSVISVTPFAGDYDYYVNTATGNDRNKGNTPSAPFRTLSAAYKAIYTNVPGGASAKITLTGDAAVSEELRVFDKDVNIVAASGASAKIYRSGSYTGPLFRVAAGGRLRLGSTDEGSGTLKVGASSAAAPCVLVDGGELIIYSGASVAENVSSVSGAGVYVKSGSFSMLGGAVKDNRTSRYGGGVYAEDGSVIISGGSISGNTAGIYGGGAYIAADADHSIDEALFGENSAAQGFDDICYGEPPAAPEIVGVEDGAEYSLDDYPEGVSAAWSGDAATATLNGEPYEEGSKITEPGDYVLTVTDGFSVVTVSFRVWQPSHEPFRVEAFLSDNAEGETGWVGFDMNGNEEPERYFVPEKPVAAAVYLAGTVYGYSEDGYFFTADMDEELPEGALRYSNMVWSDGPVIAYYTVLDMTYDYRDRAMTVLLADDDNKRYVGVIEKDGAIRDEPFPLFDAANTESSPLLMTLACSADGLYYAISGGDNAALWMLTGIDEDGAYVTKLFDFGCEAYYLQSMAFDLNTDTLYWAQCGMDRSSIYRVDIEDEFLGYCGSPLGADAELTALLFFFDIDTSEVYDTEDGLFKYSYLPEGGVEIVGYNFKDDAGEPNFEKYDENTFLVEVPAQINGMEVLSIGKYAFRDRSVGEDPVAYMQIGKVILPESLETIGYGAFRGCASLQEVEFGGQEREIGDYAFYQCGSLIEAYLPWPLETIGYGAFSECASLQRVIISGPTENFGDYIFYNAPEDLEIWGVWPSATYDYAIANNIAFRDLDPYEEPAIYGVEDGEVIILTERPDGCAINWDSTIVIAATLDGEPYEEWSPITAPGEHAFFFSDGRTDVEISFTIKEEYDTPAVSGAEDGGVYNEAVTLTWDVGEATLNGEAVESGAVVSEPGEYTLRVVNGDKETVVAFTIEQAAPPVMKGDMDGDGEITVADALRALRIAAKLAEETPEAVAVGDVDGDAEITVADALKILRVAAKLADQSSLQ